MKHSEHINAVLVVLAEILSNNGELYYKYL